MSDSSIDLQSALSNAEMKIQELQSVLNEQIEAKSALEAEVEVAHFRFIDHNNSF